MSTAPVAPKPIRSPSYPNMSLREAVDEVAKIESQYRSAPVDRVVAAKVIGYSSLSGPANKALAALGSYGLLVSSGKGETRVTERARDILHAPSKEARAKSLADAAFEPELFRELRDRFVGIPVPTEDGVVTYLNRVGFNPNAVRPAAKAFLETMRYLEELGVSESHGDERRSGEDKTTYGGAVMGDFIQWSMNNVFQLEKPSRVRAVQTAPDGKEWVFVDGSETGIPMEQVIVESPAAKPDPNKRPTLPLQEQPPPKGTRREVFALDEGDVVLTFPTNLSASSFEDLDAYLKVFISKMRRLSSAGT